MLNSMLATVIDLSKLGDPAAIAGRYPGGEGACEVGAARPRVRRGAGAGGTGAAATRRSGRHDGIEVDDTTWRDIRAAAESLGITAAEFDQAAAG